MFSDKIICPNDKCCVIFDYECEWENAGDQSEHEAACPECGVKIIFEVNYHPSIENEREA